MTDNNEIGPQFDQPDPRGWLVFAHLPPELQRREDATAAADRDRAGTRPAHVRDGPGRSTGRPLTPNGCCWRTWDSRCPTS